MHVIQRGHNRDACFVEAKDYRFYLRHLQELSQQHGCSVHAYVLMTNHVHLLLTPATADGASQLMKHLGQRYVQYVNRVHRRSGTLWEGRFKSSLVQEQEYLVRCQRYIELNPVRAGMVAHPRDYSWSSYRANAGLSASALVTPHGFYSALGETSEERVAAYRALLECELAEDELKEIRAANGFALGSRRFKDEVAAILGRRVIRLRARFRQRAP